MHSLARARYLPVHESWYVFFKDRPRDLYAFVNKGPFKQNANNFIKYSTFKNLKSISIDINNTNPDFLQYNTLIEDCRFINNSGSSGLPCIVINTLGDIIQNRICSNNHLNKQIFHSDTNTEGENRIYQLSVDNSSVEKLSIFKLSSAKNILESINITHFKNNKNIVFGGNVSCKTIKIIDEKEDSNLFEINCPLSTINIYKLLTIGNSFVLNAYECCLEHFYLIEKNDLNIITEEKLSINFCVLHGGYVNPTSKNGNYQNTDSSVNRHEYRLLMEKYDFPEELNDNNFYCNAIMKKRNCKNNEIHTKMTVFRRR